MRTFRDRILNFYSSSPEWMKLNESIKEKLSTLEAQMASTMESEGNIVDEIIATQEEQKWMGAKVDQLHRNISSLQKQRTKLSSGVAALRKSVRRAESAAKQKEQQMDLYEEQLRQEQLSALMSSKRCTEMELELQGQREADAVDEDFDFYGS